jgi:2-methylisocitrate lyase-like PEP mutase family enzyme
MWVPHGRFPALATTSAGFAFSQGLPDSGDEAVVSRDRNLAYIADITAVVDLPVSADFMSGYGMKPEDVAESVTRCVATGVAGLSIEDATGDSASPLYDLPIAAERVRAARHAIDQSGPSGSFAGLPRPKVRSSAGFAFVDPSTMSGDDRRVSIRTT